MCPLCYIFKKEAQENKKTVEQMTVEEYLNDRLEEQIQWYSNKSSRNQMWYKIFKIIEMILSGLIPVAVVVGPDKYLIIKYLIAMAGTIITIIAGVHGLYNFQENWIEYRSTSETLKHEKYLFLMRSGSYADAQDPYRQLVEKAESIISHENINWAQINKLSAKTTHSKTDHAPTHTPSTGS